MASSYGWFFLNLLFIFLFDTGLDPENPGSLVQLVMVVHYFLIPRQSASRLFVNKCIFV